MQQILEKFRQDGSREKFPAAQFVCQYVVSDSGAVELDKAPPTFAFRLERPLDLKQGFPGHIPKDHGKDAFGPFLRSVRPHAAGVLEGARGLVVFTLRNNLNVLAAQAFQEISGDRVAFRVARRGRALFFLPRVIAPRTELTLPEFCGYNFEFLTCEGGGGGVCNPNIECMRVHTLAFPLFTLVVAAETDALRPSGAAVELKTAKEGGAARFLDEKLRKAYMQARLGGAAEVVVGWRDAKFVVRRVEAMPLDAAAFAASMERAAWSEEMLRYVVKEAVQQALRAVTGDGMWELTSTAEGLQVEKIDEEVPPEVREIFSHN